MSVRLARLALCLYPLAYRRRYGSEIESLVEDAGASPRVVADLLRAAAAAHLRPAPSVADMVDDDERIRLGLSSILLCWFLFALAGLSLYKTTEGPAFSHAGGAHSLLGGAHQAIQALAVLGAAAVAIGAAPLVLAALRQRRERPAVHRAALVAAGSVLVFAAFSIVLDLIVHPRPSISSGLAAAIFGAWGAAGLLCGLACVLAARRGLAAIRVRRETLRRSMLVARGLVLAMIGITLATGAYLIALLVRAPDLAAQGNGPLGLTTVGVSVGLQLAAMTLIVSVALASARRGGSTTPAR